MLLDYWGAYIEWIRAQTGGGPTFDYAENPFTKPRHEPAKQVKPDDEILFLTPH